MKSTTIVKSEAAASSKLVLYLCELTKSGRIHKSRVASSQTFLWFSSKITMSAEKRPADDDPGSSQSLVKRQNVNSSTGAVARLNASSNALVQSVSSDLIWGLEIT